MTDARCGIEETGKANDKQKIGWIGMGRMGFPMAECLIKAGYDVAIWNRTRAKAEPLAAKGGKVVDKLADLAGVDVFSIVSTGKIAESIRQDGLLLGATDGSRKSASTVPPSRSRNRPTSASGSRSAASISWRRRSPATPR
jgi:3-hydroxyisobutyrate dehydrogenase